MNGGDEMRADRACGINTLTISMDGSIKKLRHKNNIDNDTMAVKLKLISY